MARKKSKTKTVVSKETSPPPPPPSSPPSSPPLEEESLKEKEATSTKLETLQSLNAILVRETSAMREQMKNVQSQMMELCGGDRDNHVSSLVGDQLDISTVFTNMKSSTEERRLELERRIQAGGELVESLRRSKEELVGEASGLRDEIRVLKKEDEEKSVRVSKLEKMNVDLKGEIQGLKGEFEVQSSKIGEVQCLSETLNDKISSLKKKTLNF